MKKRLVNNTTKKKLYVKGSDFCLDLAELVFAGIILAGIMGMDFDNYLLVTLGLIVLIFAIADWYSIVYKGKSKTIKCKNYGTNLFSQHHWIYCSRHRTLGLVGHFQTCRTDHVNILHEDL